MLGKLFEYDMGALSKPLLPLEVIALAVSLAASACAMIGYWSNEVSIMSGGLEDLISALMFMGLLAGFLGIACLVPATLAIILHRFYANLYSDQGYLTFTLPVRTSDILWSKVLAGALWLGISCLVALAGSLLMSYAMYGFASETSLSSTLPYWIVSGEFDLFGSDTPEALAPFTFLSGVIRTLLGIFALLLMAYTGFTLGATWARQHKIACGIALFLGIWVAVSMITGTIGIAAASFIDMAFSNGSSGSYQAVSEVQRQLTQGLDVLRNLIVCVGGFLICYVCLRKHVNLS